MVAAACVEALKGFGVKAQVMYGQAAWVEVLGDHTVIWSGCWGTNFTFWVATEFGETVDLNASVSHRKRPHDRPELQAQYSPPMLWSREIPKFYRYIPEGVAELELTEARDLQKYDLVLREIHEKCTPAAIAGQEPQFPPEAIICPGRRILDDGKGSFRHFDRALSVKGIPHAPL